MGDSPAHPKAGLNFARLTPVQTNLTCAAPAIHISLRGQALDIVSFGFASFLSYHGVSSFYM